jgi:signal transduction histidine kinase
LTGGQPGLVLAIVRDITERKRAEAALTEYSERLEEMVEARTQELQAAQEQLVRQEKLAMLGQLAGSMSHELRNPLTTISNAVYYLKMVLAGDEADETIQEYLDIITSEVRDASKIISDLLDFSRIRPADKEKIAVSDLVARVLEKRPAPEGVEVKFEIATGLPALFVDARQIQQVLVNLVTNAFQAMTTSSLRREPAVEPSAETAEGGEMTIRADMVGEQVRISVTDTGHGISDEHLSKLFDPLFTTKAKGIGLGLTISKTLVEANGGSIAVQSQEGIGTTLTILLPMGPGGSNG